LLFKHRYKQIIVAIGIYIINKWTLLKASSKVHQSLKGRKNNNHWISGSKSKTNITNHLQTICLSSLESWKKSLVMMI